jgi:hypothetical protein
MGAMPCVTLKIKASENIIPIGLQNLEKQLIVSLSIFV